MLLTSLLTVIFAVLLWWSSTAAIMALYGRSRLIIGAGFTAWTVGAFLALVSLVATRNGGETLDVYIAVTSAVILWGWQIASYFLGYVTGPGHRQAGSAAPRTLAQRFRLALSFNLHHELLAIAGGVVIALLTLAHENRWGLWMYLVLWVMHTSAKLNVFLGVRNFNADMLPSNMRYLKAVFGKRRQNALFPFSITFALSAAVGLLYLTVSPDVEPAHGVGALLIVTMIFLGMLEHGLLMMPLSPAFNGWGMGARPLPETAEVAVAVVTEQDVKGRMP
jgi:putative photosynthetic complex assembly protein 2